MTVIQGRTLPLPADMTRCLGEGCITWRSCARNATIEVDPGSGREFDYANYLCAPVDGKPRDFYIEVLK